MEIEAVATSYRRWAPVYDATFGAFTRARPPARGRAVNRRGGSVLEVGVGTGRRPALVRAALEVTGVDYSAEMLAQAPRRRWRRSASPTSRCDRMDARALEFPDASFDTVVAMHVISVVPEPERVVAEMARVCRPGGEVLILGHFLHERGALGFLGRRMAPLADQLGWHPDFPKAPVLACDRLELVEETPSPPFGMFTRLRLRRAAGLAAGQLVHDLRLGGAEELGHLGADRRLVGAVVEVGGELAVDVLVAGLGEVGLTTSIA